MPTTTLDLSNQPLEEGPGTRIGRYKLLQKIGEGGMGLVYMAEQEEPVRRRVALKIIKLGMETKQYKRASGPRQGCGTGTANYTVFNDRGVVLEHLGETNRALEDYTQAIRLAPNNARPYFNRAFLLAHIHQWEKAINDYDRAISAGGHIPAFYYGRGRAWEGEGHPEKAIADYTECLSLDPDSVVALRARCLTWLKLRQWDKAIDDFTKLIARTPSDAKAYYNRGMALGKSGEWAAAIADYTKALKLDPLYGRAYSARALALARKQEWHEAIDDATQAIKPLRGKVCPGGKAVIVPASCVCRYRGLAGRPKPFSDTLLPDRSGLPRHRRRRAYRYNAIVSIRLARKRWWQPGQPRDHCGLWGRDRWRR